MVRASDEVILVRRGRLQRIAAVISLGLFILAAVIPAWIEEFTGLDPDGGNGELEWLLAVVFGAVSLVLGVLYYRTRRRLAVLRG
jgi:hypothetical protein